VGRNKKGESMNIKTVDSIKLMLEIVYGDPYLKWYFTTQFTNLHLPQPLDDTVKDFCAFRNDIKDEQIKAVAAKTPILAVTRLITL
jgi:hypothetical protein